MTGFRYICPRRCITATTEPHLRSNLTIGAFRFHFQNLCKGWAEGWIHTRLHCGKAWFFFSQEIRVTVSMCIIVQCNEQLKSTPTTVSTVINCCLVLRASTTVYQCLKSWVQEPFQIHASARKSFTTPPPGWKSSKSNHAVPSVNVPFTPLQMQHSPPENEQLIPVIRLI